MNGAPHLTAAELEAGLPHIHQSPNDDGTVEMIVRRPTRDEREILAAGDLHPVEGLVGDSWKTRGSKSTPDGSADRAMQLTVMNARVAALLAREKVRWPLAGDQLFVDLDLSIENLPPGTQLAIGSAIIQISAEPHTGCKKFLARFGNEALQFVNSPNGRQLRLRGLNARIVQAGIVRVNDGIRKLPP